MPHTFLVHGSIAHDVILKSTHSFGDGLAGKDMASLSVGFLAEHFSRHHGGTAANIAWSLRLLGQTPIIHGTVGKDGGEYLLLLKEHGIDVKNIEKRMDAYTATAIIATDSGNRQITFFHPGADALGSIPSHEVYRDDVALSIIAPRDIECMMRAAEECAKWRMPYVFDPGQQSLFFSRENMREAVSGSCCLVLNEYEWSLSQETLGWTLSQTLAACPLVVISQGALGLTLHARNETVEVPACAVDTVVDPTGAGDALRAGLLIGLAEQWPLVQTGRLAAAMGSCAVEREGTLLSTLEREDVNARVMEHYGQALPSY